MEVEIGTVEPGEAVAVVALWRESGLTRPWNDPEADLRLALATGESTVLVARRQGEVVGAAMVGHDGHRGALYYLAVAASERRGGIGRALVRAAEAWCGSRGMLKLNLLVRKENQGVLAFYAALGYRDTDSLSLSRVFDEEAAAREAAQKAAWAARRNSG